MTPTTNADRERLYTEYLRIEGYRPDLDVDGKVRFHRRGIRYTIHLDDLQEHFCVSVPIAPLKSLADRVKANKAALVANDSTKVARICVYEAFALAEVSTYFSPPEQFKPVFLRIMAGLESVMEAFDDEMKKQ
ncbi:MAG TPA: hypothetical protein VJU15_06835 [Gemmatimonadales bacterium]|nr:hypothetical protein [Gemmatimonadales bacterium]